MYFTWKFFGDNVVAPRVTSIMKVSDTLSDQGEIVLVRGKSWDRTVASRSYLHQHPITRLVQITSPLHISSHQGSAVSIPEKNRAVWDGAKQDKLKYTRLNDTCPTERRSVFSMKKWLINMWQILWKKIYISHPLPGTIKQQTNYRDSNCKTLTSLWGFKLQDPQKFRSQSIANIFSARSYEVGTEASLCQAVFLLSAWGGT